MTSEKELIIKLFKLAEKQQKIINKLAMHPLASLIEGVATSLGYTDPQKAFGIKYAIDGSDMDFAVDLTYNFSGSWDESEKPAVKNKYKQTLLSEAAKKGFKLTLNDKN